MPPSYSLYISKSTWSKCHKSQNHFLPLFIRSIHFFVVATESIRRQCMIGDQHLAGCLWTNATLHKQKNEHFSTHTWIIFVSNKSYHLLRKWCHIGRFFPCYQKHLFFLVNITWKKKSRNERSCQIICIPRIIYRNNCNRFHFDGTPLALTCKVIHKGQEICAIFCSKMAIYAYSWWYCLLLLQWVSRGFVVHILTCFIEN